ncbi:M14 family zinc carboxypeptidase [Nonomuraea sp. NPDC050404]|uniref:M14 family zinc carboxypeptidase n=1 Tax=Nonomuraea sp. NPDC050404 TaxID=3155783 RepID=UPI0033E58B39
MYRTVEQIDALAAQLAAQHPALCTLVRLPNPSIKGRTIHALRLRSADATGERRGVLLIGGTHARELMNPDLLIELAVDLVAATVNGTDVVLGARRWPAADLQLMLRALDVYLLPCVNPDGRTHVLTVDDMWRKNRRDNPGTTCDGVDLNRNADLLWGVAQGQTSCRPCTDIYAGSAAFSEPETRNVKHLLDSFRIHCFADVHSYSELVLHPWGHAATQTTDPAKRFTTLPTGTCQPLADSGYAEYMPAQDQFRFRTVGQRIVDAIADVRGHVYANQTGFDLYPTTGTQSDYAYSRHIARPALGKVYGYTIETGPWMGNARDSFHPANPEPVKDEAESGLLAFIQQCICAIDLLGAAQPAGAFDRLVRVRDDFLATTAAGRAWIALFDRAQIPLLAAVLADERLRARATQTLSAVAALLADPGNRLGRDLTDPAAALLRDLATGDVADDVADDVRAVITRLERLAGRTVEESLRDLMGEGPRGES